jgi:hypothetical protein
MQCVREHGPVSLPVVQQGACRRCGIPLGAAGTDVLACGS